MAVGRFFFSPAPTAQNSPELQLNFRFINPFIQPSRVGSLYSTMYLFLSFISERDKLVQPFDNFLYYFRGKTSTVK